MSPPVLRLDDAAHWTDLSGALDEAVGRSLMDGASGIAISAPSAIPLGARDTAPLWGLRV